MSKATKQAHHNRQQGIAVGFAIGEMTKAGKLVRRAGGRGCMRSLVGTCMVSCFIDYAAYTTSPENRFIVRWHATIYEPKNWTSRCGNYLHEKTLTHFSLERCEIVANQGRNKKKLYLLTNTSHDNVSSIAHAQNRSTIVNVEQ